MNGKFNSSEFLNRVGRKLVIEFDDASQAGTPGLIGSAREHPARKSLEKLLPGAVAVGSGLVIDSYGTQSKQQDIVVYERDWCPVFSINDTPEATFFPCEGVAAVGEVKSSLGANELEDAFEKIASVKRLRRRAIPSKTMVVPEGAVSFRSFGTSLAMNGIKEEEFDQLKKSSDQIFGFILCGDFKLKADTIFEKAINLWRQYPKTESPNILLSLKDGFFQPLNEQRQLALSPLDGSSISYSPDADKVMGCLVTLLNSFVRRARTVEVHHFNRYFIPADAQYSLRKISAL